MFLFLLGERERENESELVVECSEEPEKENKIIPVLLMEVQ